MDNNSRSFLGHLCHNCSENNFILQIVFLFFNYIANQIKSFSFRSEVCSHREWWQQRELQMGTVPKISPKHGLFYLYLCSLMGRFLLSSYLLHTQTHQKYFRLDPDMAYYYLHFRYEALAFLVTGLVPFHGALAHYINNYRTDEPIWHRMYQMVVVNTDSCIGMITAARRPIQGRNPSIVLRTIYHRLFCSRNNDKHIVAENRFKLKLTFMVMLAQLAYLLFKVMLSKYIISHS